MPENTLYTLARSLQNTNHLQRDFSEMLSSLQHTIETEYLQKIRTAARNEKSFSVEHPPKEVTLLRALSAFTDETGRDQIERMTQSLLFLHTMQQIRQDVQTFSSGNLLEARSAEGLPAEELPSARSVQMAGLLLTLAMLEHF